jgi:methionyl-tRNA synthetase
VVDVVAEMPKNTANAVVPPHVPLTQKEFDRIINLGKGNRPKDVLEYLPREYVEAHLKRFREEGGAFIVIEKWIKSDRPDRQAFQKEGKFVGLRSEMDKLIEEYRRNGNDWKILRDKLNLGEEIDLSDTRIVYVKLPLDSRFDYKMPTGNEPGAYDGEWVPGGYTKDGLSEASLVGGDAIEHRGNIDNIVEIFGDNAEVLK